MREDDRTGASETRPDRQYRMPPCPIDSQIRGVGHDHGGRTHRTCALSNFEPRSTWLKGATWEIPVRYGLGLLLVALCVGLAAALFLPVGSAHADSAFESLIERLDRLEAENLFSDIALEGSATSEMTGWAERRPGVARL